MKKSITLVITVMLSACLLCACSTRRDTKTAAKAVPTAIAATPTSPAETPFDEPEKPTPTPLMDTDQMIEDAKEDMEEMIEGDDPLFDKMGTDTAKGKVIG